MNEENIIYQDGKYYEEINKDVLLLNKVRNFFGSWIKIAKLLDIGYNTFHVYYTYKGLTYKHALLLSYYSNNKFDAYDLLYLCYKPDNDQWLGDRKVKYSENKLKMNKKEN